MINYGRTKSSTRPQEIEITESSVIVASSIEPYTEMLDEHEVSGYAYNYIIYDKDEYIAASLADNETKINQLKEELAAAKILLGVE